MARKPNPTHAAQRSDLVDRMYARMAHEYTREDIHISAKAILESMAATLAEGRSVTVRGFGRLTIQVKPAAAMRNPRTGEPVTSAKKYVRFRAYPPLMEAIQASAAAAGRHPPRPAVVVDESQMEPDREATTEPVG